MRIGYTKGWIRSLALLPILGITIPAVCLGQEQTDPKPNIIYILADDLGWADVGFHGSEIKTPHLDRLAGEGVRLEQFYAQPACTPTRAALLTGRYPMRYGLQTGVLWAHEQRGLPLNERILPQALKEGGYETAIIGKWHLGHHMPAYLPENRGFDHQYGHYTGGLDYFKHTHRGIHDWHRDGQPVYEEGYATDLLAREAEKLISEHPVERPLFLYLAFNAPHSPLQAQDKYLEMYDFISGTDRRTYAAMVSNMDEAIGKVIAALEKKGMLDNTLIVFSSDNGGPLNAGADNGKLRNDKGSLYEGGVRVPAIAYWRGKLKPGTCNEFLHVTDWYPTFLRLAGVPLRQPLPVDGQDIWSCISEDQTFSRDKMLIRIEPVRGAIIKDNWKLIINGDLDLSRSNWKMVLNSQMDWGRRSGSIRELNLIPAATELFNLADDPYEKHNLAGQYPGKVRKLRSELYKLSLESAPAACGIIPPENYSPPAIWGEFNPGTLEQ